MDPGHGHSLRNLEPPWKLNAGRTGWKPVLQSESRLKPAQVKAEVSWFHQLKLPAKGESAEAD